MRTLSVPLALMMLLLLFCLNDTAALIVSSPNAVVPAQLRLSSYQIEPLEPESEKGIRSWSHLKSRSAKSGVSDWERDVLMSVGQDFGVPAQYLYGIWSVETCRQSKGWHRSWPLARTLPRFGSECARRYGIIKCRNNWAALQRICSQLRDGQPICNPKRVRTSRALAMGPMQHLPIKFSPADGVWASYAYDYDGDNTYDPHVLADAMASSAGHLHQDFVTARDSLSMTEANAWRYAVRMYLGQATARRYERKVYRYARNWCSLPGYCD